MTDLFPEEQLPREAELASAAVDGELLDGDLLDGDKADLAEPATAGYLALFRDLSIQIAMVEAPAAQVADDAVAAALDAWQTLDVEPRRREPTREIGRDVDGTVGHSGPAMARSSAGLRRQSRHGAKRWSRPAIGALTVLVLLAVGVSMLNRRTEDASLQTASMATVDNNVKSAISDALSDSAQSATSVSGSAGSAGLAATTSAASPPASNNPGYLPAPTALGALEQYIRDQSAPARTSSPEPSSPSTTSSTRCGVVASATADLPTGPILIAESVDAAGQRTAQALDPRTCTILAELPVP